MADNVFTPAPAVLQQVPVAPQLADSRGQSAPAAAPVSIGGALNEPDGSLSAALEKMGRKIIAPVLERVKTQRMTEGMMLALQGRSAKSIQDDEIMGDWFGDSATVSGARQVEVMTKLQAQQNDLIDRMPQLAEMDPADFRAMLPQQLQEHATGDPQTDGLLFQAAMERLPQITDAHLKAHIGWKNEKARIAYAEDFNTAAHSYQLDQLSVRAGKMNPQMADNSRKALLERIAGPEGMNPAKYPGYLYGALDRMLSEGNLEAYYAVRDAIKGGEAGNALSDTQRARLEAMEGRAEAVRNATTGANAAAGTSLVLAEAQLKAGGGEVFKTLDDVDRWTDAFNADMKLKSGSEKDWIDSNHRTGLKRMLTDAWAQAADKAAKAQDDETGIQMAMQTLIAHREAADGWHYKEKWMDEAKDRLFTSAYQQDPAKAMALVAGNPGKWRPVEQALLSARNAANTGRMTDADLPAYKMLDDLAKYGGEDVLGRYTANQEEAAKLIELSRIGAIKDQKDRLERFAESVKYWGTRAVPLSQDQKDDVSSQVAKSLGTNTLSKLSPFAKEGLANYGLDDSGKSFVMAQIMPDVQAAYSRRVDVPTAVARALGKLESTTDFVLGQPVPVAGGESTFISKVNQALQVAGVKSAITQQSKVYQDAVRAVADTQYRMGKFPTTLFGNQLPILGITSTSDGMAVRYGEPGGQTYVVRLDPAAIAAQLAATPAPATKQSPYAVPFQYQHKK